jgi:hypothetical protein
MAQAASLPLEPDERRTSATKGDTAMTAAETAR